MIKMKKNHSNILFWTSLVCSYPWGCKESDTTERLNWLNILFLLFSHSVVPNSLETPMDYSLPGSSVHGILQARTLEWVATSFSRGSSDPGIKPMSPALQGDSLAVSHLGSPLKYYTWLKNHLIKIRLTATGELERWATGFQVGTVRKSWFEATADVCGVNIPSMISMTNLKLPSAEQLAQKTLEILTVSSNKLV